MKRGYFIWLPIVFCFTLVLSKVDRVHAGWLNKAKTIELKGKVQSRLSFSTEDTTGFTSPEVDSGSFVQHRNLAYLEFNHKLDTYGWKDVQLQYHLLGRFLYEGIYDYGADEYRQVKESNRDEIEDFQKDAELWEGYVDITKGATFARIGRQSLAWGETDIFRLLDNVNPLDNTYGGIFEDLDDRRIPLQMARANYNFDRVGPISNFLVEGYWVPGFAEMEVAPFAPAGTRYAFPLPDISPFQNVVVKPEKDMDNSRYGIRHTGILGENFNYTIAYMRTILDTFGARINTDFTNTFRQELIFDPIDIAGGSFNVYSQPLDTIFRGEVAYFFDEAVFIPEENLSPLLTMTPGIGNIPEKDIVRYMLGIDKYMFIRFLNPDSMFFLSLQYFGQNVIDHDDRMRQAVPLPPDGASFPEVKEYEHQFTFLATTNYLHGAIEPQVAAAYDVRGAWFIQPQVTLKVDPFRFLVQYSTIFGEETGFGLLGDRDQLTFSVTWLF